MFTVRTLERLGISAVIIEDKTGLKRNSLLGHSIAQAQADASDFAEKIRAGKNALVTDVFMIIARIESLILGESVQQALERARIYIDAGADGIMIHSKDRRPDEIIEFCEGYSRLGARVPLVAVPSTYNVITESELDDHGVQIVIYANHMLRASYPAMIAVAELILEHERSLETDGLCMSISDILELIPGAG